MRHTAHFENLGYDIRNIPNQLATALKHSAAACKNVCVLLLVSLQFKLLSNDVFDQFRVNGVLDPAVDVEFNALHPSE